MPTLETYIKRGREAAQVSLDEIVPDPENVRRHYTKKELIPLAYSIAKKGQLQPAIVEEVRGEYRVVAGNRRYWASRYAREHGLMSRDCMLATVTSKLPEKLRLEVQRRENEDKEKVPSYRFADSIWGMYQVMLAERTGQSDVYEAETYWGIPVQLRSQLSVTEYSRLIDLDQSTVRRAFRYQRLNQVIRKEVRQGDVSYSAVEPLASVENKNHQITILGSARQSLDKDKKVKHVKATERRVRNALKEYYQYLWKEREGFMQPQELKDARRTDRGKVLSSCLGEASRIVRILETLVEFDSSVLDLEASYDGGKTNPKEILARAYDALGKFHNQFISNQIYRRRWEYAPKVRTLEEFVLGGKAAEGDNGEVMQSAAYELINVAEIDPNPLNPRGKAEDFDQERLEELADSIKNVGLIQSLLVMRKGKRYLNLEGHRRVAAAKIAEIEKARALVLPLLSREEQLAIMYDADIFERLDLHDRAEGIARQFKLELEENPKLTVDDFCKEHEKSSRKIIIDALAYDTLHQRVKRMYQEGLLTYPLVVREIAQENDPESQVHLAESIAMFHLSSSDIAHLRNINGGQQTLWSKKQIAAMRREGQRRWMINFLKNSLESVSGTLGAFSERDIGKFLQDYYLSHKFQRFFSNLENAVKSIAA